MVVWKKACNRKGEWKTDQSNAECMPAISHLFQKTAAKRAAALTKTHPLLLCTVTDLTCCFQESCRLRDELAWVLWMGKAAFLSSPLDAVPPNKPTLHTNEKVVWRPGWPETELQSPISFWNFWLLPLWPSWMCLAKCHKNKQLQ